MHWNDAKSEVVEALRPRCGGEGGVPEGEVGSQYEC